MRGGLYTSGRSVSLRSALSCLYGAPTDGRRRKRPDARGFTVVEVIIVLAISGLLFVSAAVMISGRQNQTAFDQATQQVQSQIQQAINEVSTGFYPTNSNFQCTALVVGQPPSLSSAPAGQGTNSGCIFLGKAIQFGVDNTQPERFAVYTITGLQKGGAGGAESATLNEAKPMVVAPSSPSHSNPGYPDNSVEEELQSGLKVVRMWYNDGGADVEIGAIAFVNSLASYGGTGEIVSGAGSVNVVALDGTSLGSSKLATAELMNSDAGNRIATGNVNPSGGVFICFENGGVEDYAIVRIGGENRELSVILTTKDKGGSTCTYP